MNDARVALDPAFRIGPVNPRLFGTFVEHMGRCVYTGIYEPGHPRADEFGFRQDVAELVRELGATLVRYPGGNFVSNYRWEDGVGPVAERPARLDYAWRSIEPNRVGTNEFLAWCERQGIEPVLAVNLGTRGLAEAMDFLEYVNGPAEVTRAQQRVADGREQPWGVRTWCLGNEMDGPWQMGHKTAREYGRLVAEVGNAFHQFDDRLELIACGSSGRSMPTFGEWEREVLDAAFDHVSDISAHAYYEPLDGDEQSFLLCAEDMDRFIAEVVATADHVAAVHKSDKRINISFDEWNVWYHADFDEATQTAPVFAPRLIEDAYSVMDAVVVGCLLITLLRHTDRVALACQAQLVNVIAPIRSEPGGPAWRQTIFHPFALTARHATGEVLDLRVDGPTIATPQWGDVPQVWSCATWDRDAGELTCFLANRSLDRATTAEIDLSRFPGARIVEHAEISDPDPHACNTADQPDRVVPHAGTSRVEGPVARVELPAVSWHCVRFAVK